MLDEIIAALKTRLDAGLSAKPDDVQYFLNVATEHPQRVQLFLYDRDPVCPTCE